MNAKIQVKSYNGIPIRVLEMGNDNVIPATDIAKALGCSRKNITQIISGNPHLFPEDKGVTVTYPLPTAGGTQEHVCLNHVGLVAILMRISVGRAGTDEGKQRIERFQSWAQGVLSASISGIEKVPDKPYDAIRKMPSKSPSAIAYEASRFAKMTGADQRDVTARLLIREGYDYLVDLLPASENMPRLPAPSQKPPGWLNATDIGRIIGRTAEQVNNFLYFHQLIIKDSERPGEWRITHAGMDYGIEKSYEPVPGKSMFRVFWRPEVLRIFNYNK